MTQREYQRRFCESASRPIVNIACKEDPWRLRDFDCVNLDLLTFDPHTRVDLTTLPNFVQGDATKLPFSDASFESAVMGEFIEHCDVDVATKALEEAARVLSSAGKLCLTFPLDSRKKEGQHRSEHLIDWASGITSWHRTIWTDEMLAKLFNDAGFVEIHRDELGYDWAEGWGITVQKK